MNVPASRTRTAVDVAQAELAAIVGDSRVTSESASCESFAVDGKAPKYVVYPSSAEQVAAALKCARDLDLAVIPCRNLTKIGIGNPPRRYDVALSLKEMNRVWYYEPADLVISVEPGIRLGDFQRFVWRHRLWLPLDPPGSGRTSIGGIPADRMTFLQADNTMKTFAKESGGAFYPVTFEGELPDVLGSINALLRSQYSLGFKPDDVADGKSHKIVVKVDVDGDGVYDDKAYVVRSREVYNSPKPDAASGGKTAGRQ